MPVRRNDAQVVLARVSAPVVAPGPEVQCTHASNIYTSDMMTEYFKHAFGS
jgi:hypothetical protein